MNFIESGWNIQISIKSTFDINQVDLSRGAVAQRISTEEFRSVGQPVTPQTGDQTQARFQEALPSPVWKLLRGAQRARAD